MWVKLGPRGEVWSSAAGNIYGCTLRHHPPQPLALTSIAPAFKLSADMSAISHAPVVELTQAFTEPFLNAVATARTCYSGKGIIDEAHVGPRAMDIARSIYQAGHHTTLQHATFQFALSNVSRQFIWSFLHSHPFYNSEQVSQRYVAVKPDMAYVPPLSGEALAIYERGLARQHESYRRLSERLAPLVEAEMLRLFRSRKPQHVEKAVKKKAQEFARYVLPVATYSYLYHTVSGITLLRYWRTCQGPDVPEEQRAVVGRMVELLLQHDPNYREILEAPMPPEQFPELGFTHDPAQARRFVEDFDRQLGPLTSKLVGRKENNVALLAEAVREVLGRTARELSDGEAIELALSPARNHLLSENMNLSTHSKLLRAMAHPAYSFRKKLSHTADSQDQRHRMTPASRPVLGLHYTGEPDYIAPRLVQSDEAVKGDFDEEMARIWEDVESLRRRGVPMEHALYLLPNAVSVRFTESSDLLNLHHKHAMRLCYNAQEEIWRASHEEAVQIRRVEPEIGGRLLPPCSHRAQARRKPICPEGERYCGVVVWKLDLQDYRRVI